MKLKISLYFIGLLLTITQCSTPTQQHQQVIHQKQVIPGELPDPSIIEVNGIYYATGSSNDWGPIYPIYQSNDLEHWTFVNHIFSTPPSWTINSYWAPELYYENGTFFCYYTARRTDGTSCIGVASTADISNGFEDHGVIIEWGNEAIDAFVYKENDTKYITWKAYGLNKGKPIQILGAPLSANGLSLNGEAFEVITADNNLWERGGTEGQCIIKNGEYLYLIYSGNACCGQSCDYQVGVARAKTMMGPWQKFDKNPILKSNQAWKCPGHGTAIQTKNNWYYLYHAYPQQGFPFLGRTVLLSQLLWDTESEWPYFSTDSIKDPNALPASNFKDDFQEKQLNYQWQRNMDVHAKKAYLQNGKLHLSADSTNSHFGFIGVSPEKANFTITTKISDLQPVLKGLSIYSTPKRSIGIGVKNDSIMLWSMDEDQLYKLNTLYTNTSKTITLKAEVKNGHQAKFYFKTNEKDWQQIKDSVNEKEEVIGNQLAWWSWGIRAGLFVEAQKSSENEATFDNFEIKY